MSLKAIIFNLILNQFHTFKSLSYLHLPNLCYFYFRVSDNIVTNINEVYSVGSLGRINEMREFGNKLHMLIQCFRRIKLTKPLFEDQDIDKSTYYL